MPRFVLSLIVAAASWVAFSPSAVSAEPAPPQPEATAPPVRIDTSDARGATINGETIILCGGTALRKWEDLRIKSHRHDRWWGNFAAATNLRTIELIKKGVPPQSITWLVYRPAYISRSAQDEKPIIKYFNRLARKNGANIRWFDHAKEVIDYINKGRNRKSMPVVQFEFFGHSNKHALLIDYSCSYMGASGQFIHESDLNFINKRAFHRKAYAKSWGCHSAEGFTKAWKRKVGVKMWGAVGKTDYSKVGDRQLPFLSSPNGKWKQ